MSRRNQSATLLRAYVAWGTLELSGATLTELGHFMSRDVSTLSSAARRLREKATGDEEITQHMEKLQQNFADFATSKARPLSPTLVGASEKKL